VTDVMAGDRDPGGPRADSSTVAAGRGRAGFREAVASEWTKVRTVRSMVWLPVAMALPTLGLAVFVGATESLQPDDTVLGGSLTGAGVAVIAAAGFGVVVMSGEYGTGMIRATLAASPRRVTVLAAKAVVVAASTFVLALGGSVVAYQIGRVSLSGQGYAPGEPMPALLGVIVLPSLIGPLFGDGQRWVAGASPTAALQKLAQSSDAAPDAVGSLGAWPSLWLVCAYTVAAMVAGAWSLERRDA